MKITIKKLAFTLAEILITIGIIGIVVSMTIPTLINNTSNKVNISAWKKNYSAISQAWMDVVQDNGGTGGGLFSTMDNIHNNYGDLITEKLNTIKKCPPVASSTADNECWHNTNKWYNLSNYPIFNSHSSIFSAILKDGTLFTLGAQTNDCPTDNFQCFFFAVDVNGKKAPNKQGKDIFFGSATGGGKIRPHSVARDASDTNDDYNCVETFSSISTTQGQGCSKLALYCEEIDYTKGICKQN